jgi:hypothetical protein
MKKNSMIRSKKTKMMKGITKITTKSFINPLEPDGHHSDTPKTISRINYYIPLLSSLNGMDGRQGHM